MAFGMVEDPVDDGERSAVAKRCVDDLDLPMPALIDRIDDAVNQAYKGWPDRLYLVDREGKIAYAGGRGPFFFSTDALEERLQAVVGEQ